MSSNHHIVQPPLNYIFLALKNNCFKYLNLRHFSPEKKSPLKGPPKLNSTTNAEKKSKEVNFGISVLDGINHFKCTQNTIASVRTGTAVEEEKQQTHERWKKLQ